MQKAKSFTCEVRAPGAASDGLKALPRVYDQVIRDRFFFKLCFSAGFRSIQGLVLDDQIVGMAKAGLNELWIESLAWLM